MDDGAVLAMSGVSGVTIDFDNQTDGTNSSGFLLSVTILIVIIHLI